MNLCFQFLVHSSRIALKRGVFVVHNKTFQPPPPPHTHLQALTPPPNNYPNNYSPSNSSPPFEESEVRFESPTHPHTQSWNSAVVTEWVLRSFGRKC